MASKRSNSSTHAIVAGVIGAVAVLSLVASITFVSVRRWQQRKAGKVQHDAEASFASPAAQVTEISKTPRQDVVRYSADGKTHGGIENIVPTPRTFPPPQLLVHRPEDDREGDYEWRRPCTAPPVPAKDSRRYFSLDSHSLAKAPLSKEYAGFETDPVTRSISRRASHRQSQFGDATRKSPRPDREYPRSGNFLSSPRSFERPMSVVSITSTLYSSDASIHEAETRSVVQPERPRLTNRLSDSAVLMRGSRPYSSPMRISM